MRPGARRPRARHHVRGRRRGPQGRKEAARLAALAADAGLRDAKRTLARITSTASVPRDPEKAARLIGLERTATSGGTARDPRRRGFCSARRGRTARPRRRADCENEYSPAEMDAFFGPEGAITCSRRRNHHAVVVRLQTRPFLHKRSESKKRHDAVAPSPSRKKRRRNEPPQRQGRATPLHTSTPSPRARRRDRPAPRYTRSSSRQSAAHVIPQSQPTTSSHSKSNTRREGIAQARTTNQGPGPARPRRRPHTIIASRETRQQSRATKARSRRRVPTATHSVRPQKHKRRVAVRRDPPCEDRSRTRTPPRASSSNPTHTKPHISQQTLDDGERRASHTPQRNTPPLAPPRRPPGEKDHPSPRRSRAQSAPRRTRRGSHHSHKRAATAPRASSARTAFRPPGRRAAAEQSRFRPRGAPAGVRHAGVPQDLEPFAGYAVAGRTRASNRRRPARAQGAGRARPRSRGSASKNGSCAAPRAARRRAAPGAAPARPAPGPRGGGGVARWRRARRRFRRVGASGAGSALKSG